MCGRYANFRPAESIARLFSTANAVPNLEPAWNMAQTKDAPVVRRHPSGERHLNVLKWGLMPYFTKDLKKAHNQSTPAQKRWPRPRYVGRRSRSAAASYPPPLTMA